MKHTTKRSSTFSRQTSSPFSLSETSSSDFFRLGYWIIDRIKVIGFNSSLAKKPKNEASKWIAWIPSSPLSVKRKIDRKIFETRVYILFMVSTNVGWFIGPEFHWFRVHGNGSRHWVRIGSTRVISSLKCPLHLSYPPPSFSFQVPLFPNLPLVSLFPFLFPFVPHFALPSLPTPTPSYLFPSFPPPLFVRAFSLSLSPLHFFNSVRLPRFLFPSVTVSAARMFTTEPDVPAVWHWRIAVFLIRAIRFPLRGKGERGGKNRPAAGSTHARGDDDIAGRRPSIEKEREGAKHRGERCWGDEEWKNEWSGGVERRWMRGRAVVLSVRTSLSVCLLLLRLIMLSRGEQAWLDDFHGFFFFRTVARMIYRRGTVQRVHVTCVYGKKRTRGEWKGEWIN